MSSSLGMASFLGGGTAACIICAIASNVLTKRRDAKARKLSKHKELTDFLVGWKGKITADQASHLPFVYNRDLPHLQTKAARVRNDLSEMQRAKFNELIGNLSRLTTEQITRPNGKLPQEVICEPLEALIVFVLGLDRPQMTRGGAQSERKNDSREPSS